MDHNAISQVNADQMVEDHAMAGDEVDDPNSGYPNDDGGCQPDSHPIVNAMFHVLVGGVQASFQDTIAALAAQLGQV